MKITVYDFVLGDVEDPEIYAAGPIIEWEQSEAGKWIMEHAISPPEWHINPDPFTYGYRIRIGADLEEADITYFNLKWGFK